MNPSYLRHLIEVYVTRMEKRGVSRHDALQGFDPKILKKAGL